MKIHARRRPFIMALLIMVLSMMAVGISAKQVPAKPGLASNTPSNPVLNLEAGEVSTAGPQSPEASTPNSANYVFTTSTSGTFTDMSSGTTQLVAADTDDGASAIQTLPFDFYLMGKKYNQFSVTSNGMLGLGSTAVNSALFTVYAGTTTTPVIAAFSGDLRTGAAGSVRYKVTGSAPNRIVTVEYNNMSLLFVLSPGSSDGTYQVRLYESTGQIEFIYGPMSRNSGTSALNGQQIGIGWSTANSANNMVSITSTTNLASTAVPFGQALYAAGPIANLNSPTEGARRTYSMLPPVPTAPTNLTFTNVTASSMSLNWNDSPDEVGYVIYSSIDGVNYTYFGAAASDATTFSATGLTPSTPYTWKVYAMSEGAPSTALAGSQATQAPGNILSTAVGGPWSATATWVGGVVPTANDNVTIVDGSTVTIDAVSTPNAYRVTVGQGTSGILVFNTANARTLTIVQSLTVAAGGTFQTGAASGVTTHGVSVGQDVINNGTIDFSTAGNGAGAGFIFTGSSNATFTNNGVLDLRQTANSNGGIYVNKGTGSSTVLDFVQNSATNVTTQGGTTMGFLSVANGTFKISGSGNFSNPVFSAAAYTIATTAGFWLNNANANVVAQNGAATNGGLLRITTGTFNVGTVNGNLMSGSAGAQFIIEGGTSNFANRFLSTVAVTYTQSGGTVNVSTVSNGISSSPSFGLTSAASVMNMSGGTIVLVQRNSGGIPLDYSVLGTFNYTGGTLQVGNAATATNFDFRIKGQLPALVIDNTTNAKSVLLTAQTNAWGNITINTGTTLNLSGQVFIIIGPTVTNNGTLTNTTANGRFDFAGDGPQTYTGSGTVTPGSQNIELDNPLGLTIDPASPIINALRVNLFRGTITNSNKLTLGTGGTSAAVIQVGVAGATSPGGSLDSPPTFNAGTAGVILVYAQETVARTTGFEVPPTRIVQNVTLANTNGVVLAGGNLTINGTLTLTAGNITTGANRVIIGSAGTVSRTSGHVIGNLKKTFTGATSKGFEVGTVSGYSPVTVTVTTGTFPADLTAKATLGTMPSLFDPAKSLQRYWTLTATGITADLTFNYLDPTDIPGTADENSFVIFKYDGTLTMPGGIVNTGSNLATITGVNSFSDWSLAEPQAANTPTATATSTDTPTSTPTSTSTATNIPSNTPTDTPTDTNTATSTPTNTPTDIPTNTSTSTDTTTPTLTVTPTTTNTATNTATQTNTATSTPSDTPTITPTDTPSNTPTSTTTNTPIDTRTNTPTNTPVPTNTPTDTPTTTPTSTNTATSTPINTTTPTSTPTNTPTNTNTATNTPTDTPTSPPTNTPTSTNTATDTPTNTPTSTNTRTNTPTSTDTATPTNTPTSTNTATNTPTSTDTATPTNTPTNIPTNTPTSTAIPTNTPTNTTVPTITPSDTPTSTPINTATGTPTSTPTNTPTNIPTNTPTNTAIPANTPTNTTVPTNTPTDTPSNTPASTNTATHTPTNTPTNTATHTPTSTSTNTPINTPTNTNTATNTPTNTPTNTTTNTGTFTLTPTGTVPTATNTGTPTETATTNTTTNTPTNTAIPSDTPTDVPTSTLTETPTATPTVCVVPFVDTAPSDWFYEYVQYLYCKGVINGYNTNPPCEAGTPCFKPENPTTRGQLAKIVVLAFDFTIDTDGGPSFQDVPEGSTFYPYVETAKNLGLIEGYACGGPGEPCVGPDNKPYYRTGRSVTRGQITKIVVSAAILVNPEHWTLLNPAENTFEDVAVGSTFFQYVETAAAQGVINGYPCGSAPAGECVPPGNKPYFLPSDNATRAQISKVVYLGVTTSARK